MLTLCAWGDLGMSQGGSQFSISLHPWLGLSRGNHWGCCCYWDQTSNLVSVHVPCHNPKHHSHPLFVPWCDSSDRLSLLLPTIVQLPLWSPQDIRCLKPLVTNCPEIQAGHCSFKSFLHVSNSWTCSYNCQEEEPRAVPTAAGESGAGDIQL